ncbi:MAG: DUF5367 domain-containing protein [Cyanobacteria bacterium P01_H01_bin.119]
MNTKDRVGFIALGLVVWVAGTSVYRLIGSSFFEVSAIRYWLNVGLTGVLYTVVSLTVMKWRKIQQKDWLQGAICIALPGMLGEIPILASFAELMSNMQPETAGRYAAFLFGGYSTMIGAAWFVSAKASSETRFAGTEQ